MNRLRTAFLILAGAAFLTIPGCADDPTTPFGDLRVVDAGPVMARLPSGVALEAVSWKHPLEADEVRSRNADDDGTVIRLRSVPVQLRIPEGALSDDPLDDGRDDDGDDDGRDDDRDRVRDRRSSDDHLRIWVRARAGSAVSFEFAPHGLRFDEPAVLEIDLSATAVLDAAALEDLQVVYYEQGGGASVDAEEVLPVRIEDGILTVELQHFSGYILVSG